MSDDIVKSPSKEGDGEDIFKYSRKVQAVKLAFPAVLATIGILAGFKFGFSRSAKKYGMESSAATEKLESPAKFAGRALKRATLLTVGCFAAGIGLVSLVFGMTSSSDLRDLSRRKWRRIEEEGGMGSDLEGSSCGMSDQIVDQVTELEHIPYSDEILIDKAEELKDSWK